MGASMSGIGYSVGDHDERPWGSWSVLDAGNGYIVKRITVAPGQRLSLQYHHHRSERWTVVEGTAEVEIDGVTARHEHGGYVSVPVLAKHRIRNVGDGPMVFIEVQLGQTLDENDIVRLTDDYGRVDGAASK
jgi:mannose-6-phosphate isomerase